MRKAADRGEMTKDPRSLSDDENALELSGVMVACVCEFAKHN